MKCLRVPLFLLTVALLSTLPACKEGSDKPKIAVITNNNETFWRFCEAGAKKAGEENNVTVLFRKPSPGNVATQMDIIRDLSQQNLAGMAVSVIDADNQAPDLKQIAGKMKLVTMDNDAEDSGRICYIGTDNYAAGRAAGRLVKGAMPGGGTIAVFVGSKVAPNAKQRFQGLVDELADVKDAKGPQFGKYKLHRELITDDANRAKCVENVKNELNVLPDSDDLCLVGLWAYNPPAILEGLKSKGYTKAKVVGFDEDFETLAGVDQGRVYGTVVQDPYQFGFKSVEILAAEAKGDTSKRIKAAIPYRIVTKDGGETKNVDGVEVKNLKASDFAVHLKELLQIAQ